MLGGCRHAVSQENRTFLQPTAQTAPVWRRQILCAKKGLKTVDDQCRKFKYDPCKRIPPKPKAVDFSKYDNEDFSL